MIDLVYFSEIPFEWTLYLERCFHTWSVSFFYLDFPKLFNNTSLFNVQCWSCYPE